MGSGISANLGIRDHDYSFGNGIINESTIRSSKIHGITGGSRIKFKRRFGCQRINFGQNGIIIVNWVTII